jgi:hypothetical protein
MTEENGTTPEQQPGHIAINVSPQGMTIQIQQQPITLLIAEDGMQQMVKEWLTAHPELFDELIKQRLTQRKTELAIIRDINSSKIN